MPQTIARCFAVGILLVLPKMAQAESPCPPDGDDSNWPTYEITDKCGDYDQCAALVESGRLQEAQACNQKIDNCGVNLFRSKQARGCSQCSIGGLPVIDLENCNQACGEREDWAMTSPPVIR